MDIKKALDVLETTLYSEFRGKDDVSTAVRKLFEFSQGLVDDIETEREIRANLAYNALEKMGPLLERISCTIGSLIAIIEMNGGNTGNDDGDLRSAQDCAHEAACFIDTFFAWKEIEEEHSED